MKDYQNSKGVQRMNKSRHVLTFLSIVSTLLVWGCSPKGGSDIVAQVGNEKVDIAEYERFYTRNGGGLENARKSTQQDREHFLDLLTEYKLKLLDAYDHHLDDDSSINAEIRDYRTSLASSFLIDQDLNNPGVEKMYARRHEELRARHIEIAVRQGVAPEETLKAYVKALEVIKRAQLGEPFDSLVSKFSDDPNKNIDHGDLYYFTGGQINPAFEDSAYELKAGQVSPYPVRSPAGYHVLLLTDRRPTRGIVKIRHIMTRLDPSQQNDTSAAYKRILGLQDSLKHGWDFSRLAERFSEDPGSAPEGGLLGWSEVRRWYQTFDEAALKLKPGENSPVVRTPWGYHIIHCDSIRSLPPLSEMRDTLKKTYQQLRYFDDYVRYVGRLKNDYKYRFNDSLFDKFAAHLDSTKTSDDSGWIPQIPESLRAAPQMWISGRAYSLDTVLTVLITRPEFRSTSLRATELQPVFDRIAEGFLLNEKAVGLESRSPEFATMMAEYKDGIVLFKAEQLAVWDKVAVTDSALHAYYDANHSKFQMPARVNYAQIHVSSDTLALVLYDSLSRGADFSDFAARYNEDADDRSQKGVQGFQPITPDSPAQIADSQAVDEISEPKELDSGGYIIVKTIAKEPARDKTFEEAGAELSNAVQEEESKQLEREWIDRLRLKYSVKEYKDKLFEAFQSAPK
jgi:peptidyl-prolyl cis-trans isomerase SurA